MIKRISAAGELSALPPKGVEAQKIRALLHAYGTDYDFCRFFIHNGDSFLAEMGGSYVLCSGGKCDPEEVAGFLSFNGFSELLCNEKIGTQISAILGGRLSLINLMKFVGSAQDFKVERAPALREVYEIIGTVFGFEFEPWYLDMSHRTRHGVARCLKLGGSALVIQHEINCEALISQVATLPAERGKGSASRLLSAACAELSGSEVYVLCEDRLRAFYEKNGFAFCGKLAQITAA